MRTILISILFFGFAFLSNAQEDKTPEKKLVSKKTSASVGTGKPERKMVDHTTAKKSKDGQVLGTPERKLVTK